MAFNIVQTQQEADKFTYKKNQSTVLYTIDTKNINIHGCNVITKTPTAGDVLCVTQRYKQNSDSSGWTLLPPQSQDIVWVKGDTVNMDVWPTETIGDIKIHSIEPVGICYKVRDRKAYVLYGKDVEDPDDIALAKAWRFRLTNITVPSTPVSVHIKVDNNFDHTFSVSSATNLRQFCIHIQTALARIGGNISCQYIGPHEYDPLDTDGFYTGDDGQMVLNVKQYDIPNITISINGKDIRPILNITCNDAVNDMILWDVFYFHRNNGTVFDDTSEMTSNFDLFYEYAKTSGRTLAAQPYSPIDTRSIPINEQTWNTANAKIYRDAYGSYKKYVESCMMNLYGGLSGATLNEGRRHTQMLAKARYIDPEDGEVKPLYLAPYLCNNVSVNAIGLEAGRWWMPSIGELSELFSGTIESNNIDMINSVVGKLGIFYFNKINPYDSDYKHLSCTPSSLFEGESFNYWHGGTNPEDTYFRIVRDIMSDDGWTVLHAITAVDI